MDAEGLVCVERSSGRLGVFGHQLQVGEGRDHGDREGDEEGHPRRSPDFGGHITGEGIDPGAEDVSHDEEQEQLGPHDPLEVGLDLTGVRNLELSAARSGGLRLRHDRLPSRESTLTPS